MSYEQVDEIELRNTFEYLGSDTSPVEYYLSALNEARDLLPDDQDLHRSPLQAILEEEVVPSLRNRTEESFARLEDQYQGLKTRRVQLATVIARAINGDPRPIFLHESRSGVPCPVEGRFDGFQLIDTKDGSPIVLLMRTVLGLQVHWSQPTLKNFS